MQPISVFMARSHLISLLKHIEETEHRYMHNAQIVAAILQHLTFNAQAAWDRNK